MMTSVVIWEIVDGEEKSGLKSEERMEVARKWRDCEIRGLSEIENGTVEGANGFWVAVEVLEEEESMDQTDWT